MISACNPASAVRPDDCVQSHRTRDAGTPDRDSNIVCNTPLSWQAPAISAGESGGHRQQRQRVDKLLCCCRSSTSNHCQHSDIARQSRRSAQASMGCLWAWRTAAGPSRAVHCRPVETASNRTPLDGTALRHLRRATSRPPCAQWGDEYRLWAPCVLAGSR